MMCTEQFSHIAPAEGHNMAAGFVCSEDLSVEMACSLFAIELSKTQSAASANSEGFSIL